MDPYGVDGLGRRSFWYYCCDIDIKRWHVHTTHACPHTHTGTFICL